LAPLTALGGWFGRGFQSLAGLRVENCQDDDAREGGGCYDQSKSVTAVIKGSVRFRRQLTVVETRVGHVPRLIWGSRDRWSLRRCRVRVFQSLQSCSKFLSLRHQADLERDCSNPALSGADAIRTVWAGGALSVSMMRRAPAGVLVSQVKLLGKPVPSVRGVDQ
jgi:hypothetical protein